MASLIDELNREWKYLSDNDKSTLLKNLYVEYSAYTYYELFGITEEMTLDNQWEQVKRHYRMLVLIIHPDKAKKEYKDSAEELFKLVNEAHTTLLDPDKEKSYRLKHPNNVRTSYQETTYPTANMTRQKEKFTSTSSATNTTRTTNNTNTANNTTSTTSTAHTTTNTSFGNISTGFGSLRMGKDISLEGKFNFSSLEVQNNKLSIEGDIHRKMKINTTSSNIFIIGNVKGEVESVHGHITITGNVTGSVKNTHGNITITGMVSGKVETKFGKINSQDKVAESESNVTSEKHSAKHSFFSPKNIIESIEKISSKLSKKY